VCSFSFRLISTTTYISSVGVHTPPRFCLCLPRFRQSRASPNRPIRSAPSPVRPDLDPAPVIGASSPARPRLGSAASPSSSPVSPHLPSLHLLARFVWRLDGESDLPRPPLLVPLWSPWSSPPRPPANAPPVADRQAPHWALLPNPAVRGSPPGHRPRISLHNLALKQSRHEFAACVEVVAAVAQIDLCFTPSSPLPSAPFRSQISTSPGLTSVLLSSRADASRRRRTGSGRSPGPSAARRPRERMRGPTGRPARRYSHPITLPPVAV
jgi:hypothetical protein